MPLPCTCETCGAEFTTPHVSRGARFCSTRCSGIAQRVPRITNTCEGCGCAYELLPSEIAKAKRHGYKNSYCGSRCPGRGRTINAAGYVALLVSPDDPMAAMQSAVGDKSTRYVFEHRLVMARHIGRPLLKHEEVHHRNGVKDDNRIENLELWTRDHPRGQRVEDKIAWAREILALYGEA